MKRELKIGIFVGLALLILAVFIFIIGDMANLFRKPGYPLYVSFDSTAGLEKGAKVRLAGVRVGYVKDIKLEGRRAKVVMAISPKYKINQGSKASLAALGLLGEKYIEIMPGESPHFCRPGDRIEGLSPVSIDQVGTLFLSIGNEIKDVGTTLKEMMGKESRANVKDILQNLSTFTSDLKGFLGANKENLSRSIQSSSAVLQNFDQRVKEISKNLDDTIKAVKDIADENRENVKSNLDKIKDLMNKIEETVKLLNESLGKINKGEGSLGKLINKPELYKEAEKTVSDVQRVVRAISSLQARLDFRGDYYGKSEFLKSTLTLGLWITPKKYFLAQLVQDPWLDKFTFSAQGGVRWKDFSPRAGLIESEFGAGVDYYVLNDRVTLSLESFNFNRHSRPQFRFLTRYRPHKNFYFVLGLDDFTLAAKREFFFGLGLGLQ
jgi:phospholipid/cholesterol/gamma-HCH transport system substrate-binding protein